MKHLLLMFIAINSLAFASESPIQWPWRNPANPANELPQKDKDQLNIILAGVQNLQNISQPPQGWNSPVDRALAELYNQIDRVKGYRSLSGLTTTLKANDRVKAIKNSVAAIFEEELKNKAALYTAAIRDGFTQSFKRFALYRN